MRAALKIFGAGFLAFVAAIPAAAQQTIAEEIAALEQKLKEATAKQDAEEAKAESPAKAAYVRELEKLRDTVKNKGQLDALIDAEAALKAVREDTGQPRPKVIGPALTTIRMNYEKARDFAWRPLIANRVRSNAEYDRGIADLETKYTRAGNVEAAKAARAARRILLTVDGFVDGPSTLMIRKDSVYWVNGGNAKPGPTYVDGRRWEARWSKPDQPRGEDRSDLYPYRAALPSLDLKVDLVAVTEQHGQDGIDHRTPIDIKATTAEIRITIPDPEAGARWYKFVFRLK